MTITARAQRPISFYEGPALNATAGTPGEFGPARATSPSTAAAMNAAGIVPKPSIAWLPGQYVPTVSGGAAYWNGTTWIAYNATAGIPGSYNVVGFLPQSSTMLRDMAVQATPATAWTTGQYVNTVDTTRAHWNGSAWVAGAKP
jgi:hypothetical protein